MPSQNYELKKGVSIKCHSKGGVMVTNENLTDELAIAILKEKPHQETNFTKLPAKAEAKKAEVKKVEDK